MKNIYARIGLVVAVTALSVLLIPGVDDGASPLRDGRAPVLLDGGGESDRFRGFFH